MIVAQLRAIAAPFLRRSHVPAAIALAVVVVCGVVAELSNESEFQAAQRTDVQEQLAAIQARLEGHIVGDIQLVRGVIAALSTEPEITAERFRELSAAVLAHEPRLHNLVGAPDLVATMVYPLQGNEGVLGLDYTRNPAQRQAVLRARDTGDLVLAGPVDLVQGGRGLVARFPVFVDAPWGKRFWGIISAVINVERLYADSGLYDRSFGLDLALVGKDGLDTAGQQFFGPPGVLEQQHETTVVDLPGGSWMLAAVPRGGWIAESPNTWALRLAIALSGALIVVPVLFSARLFEERQRHIADLNSRKAELRRLSRRLGLALETSRIGVWEYDIETHELFWDDRMNEIYGLPADGGVRDYLDWQRALHPDDLRRAQEDFRVATDETGSYLSEYRIVTPSREMRNVRAIGKAYRDAGSTPKIVGVNWDVSADVALNEDLKRAKTLTEARNAELESAKVRIEHNALHDSLTGLPNRRYLDEVLNEAGGGGTALALLHIDLDRFKQINDTLGHAAGDAILVHASRVLKSAVLPGDFVARIGGDEFVVLPRLEPEPKAAAALAERIIAALRQPVSYQGHSCRVGVSVGIAAQGPEGVDPKQLLINADIALYRAKNRGRNRFEFFSADLQSEVVTTKRLADEILEGLERDEFVAYYQPQIDSRTHDLAGVEALVRWRHPRRGVLGPDQFLHIAEDINVVAEIDRLVLEQTLANLRYWRATGLAVPRASVNVSARRLHDSNLIESLKALAIPPGDISFELVESIYLDESDEVVGWNIDGIKELGIDVEIDDFGTGYASIISLLKLRPRRLKIDRELVQPVETASEQRQLVKAMVEIGKSLGVEVVAEGVETMGQARILTDLGCDVLQGYAFAPALTPDALEGLLRAHQQRQAS